MLRRAWQRKADEEVCAPIQSEPSNTNTLFACLGSHGVGATSCHSFPSADHQTSLRLESGRPVRGLALRVDSSGLAARSACSCGIVRYLRSRNRLNVLCCRSAGTDRGRDDRDAGRGPRTSSQLGSCRRSRCRRAPTACRRTQRHRGSSEAPRGTPRSPAATRPRPPCSRHRCGRTAQGRCASSA